MLPLGSIFFGGRALGGAKSCHVRYIFCVRLSSEAELQIIVHFLSPFYRFLSFLKSSLRCKFRSLNRHYNICLTALKQIKSFRIKLRMAPNSLLRTLGLTPMIGTPIIGNVGQVESYVSSSEINDDNSESRYSYHSNSEEPPTSAATPPPPSHGRNPITEFPISINLQAYRLPQSVLSQDHVQLTTTSSTYFENAQSLVQLVRDQALLPPRPFIHIKGSHSEYGKAYGADKIDFELSLDMTPLLVGDGLHQASHLRLAPLSDNSISITNEKHSLKEDHETDLELWADKFCRDPAVSKR